MEKHPIAFLIDELKSDDQNKRINSVKNLQTIAIALGNERTKLELLPFLINMLDDDDEVILALLDQLYVLMSQLNQLDCFFPLVYQVSILFDDEIREGGLQIFQKMIVQYCQNQNFNLFNIEEQIIELCKMIYNQDFKQAKGSCAVLISEFLGYLSLAAEIKLIKIYQEILNDKDSSVRKYGAKNLAHIIEKNNYIKFEIQKEIIPYFEKLLKDDSEFIKINLIDSFLALIKVNFSETKKTDLPLSQEQIVNYIQIYLENASARIRYCFCEKIDNFLELSISNKLIFNQLLSVFMQFCEYQDNDVIFLFLNSLQYYYQVRAISARKISQISKYLTADLIIFKLGQMLKTLSTDNSESVKGNLYMIKIIQILEALSENILSISEIIGKKHINQIILPVLLTFLKEENNKIRINMFKSLHYLHNVIGIDTLSQSLIPSLQELSQNLNWRIKKTSQLGIPFFNEKIINIIISWLQDQIYIIRASTVQILSSLVQNLGQNWIIENLLPQLIVLQNSQNYLIRNIFILSMVSQELIKGINDDNILAQIFNYIQQLQFDKVPNVRMNLVKALFECQKKIPSKVYQYFSFLLIAKAKEIQEIINNMNFKEQDIDVKAEIQNYIYHLVDS